jgi:hypothetical protein
MNKSKKNRVNAPERDVEFRNVMQVFIISVFAIFWLAGHGLSQAATDPDPNTIDGRYDFTPAYKVKGEGNVKIEGPEYSRDGNQALIEMDYKIYADGRMEISRLKIDVENFSVRVKRHRLNFYCNTLYNRGIIEGTVDGAGNLKINDGAAKVSGISHDECESGCSFPCEPYQCGTSPWTFDEINPDPITGTHKPAVNQFSFKGAFRHREDGEDWTIKFDFSGTFINRPPVAFLGVEGEGLPFLEQGGCPPVTWVRYTYGNTVVEIPVTEANDPDGLRLETLRSVSYDPDGTWAKHNILREQWYHSEDSGFYDFIGRGASVGPEVFEFEVYHELVLVTTDRHNVSASNRCEFIVVDTTEPRVISPKSTVIVQSSRSGITPADSKELMKFLTGAKASDTADDSPKQMTPQTGGANINKTTVFPLGDTTVTFRFKDLYDNIGSATSVITVKYDSKLKTAEPNLKK